MIEGVEFRELTTHTDERGFFREVLRASDPIFAEGFAQWSHTMSYTGVAKGWHVHQKQVDWWYLALGVIKVALHDTRPDSPTHGQLMEFIMGEQYGPRVIKIPPGVAHGYRVLDGPVHLFYIVSEEYDGTDEGRIPHDDPGIGYDWTAWPAVT
jgi:dTDP-4-dehydrorhamnose 3,5-epimerase